MQVGKKIEEAFRHIDRKLFLPSNELSEAMLDVPLPIGYGQTNSQPSTVKQMLEWLDVKEGQKILDVGSGSGWTSALLSYLVGENGNVIAVEKVPELVLIGKQNCQKLNLTNVEFKQAETLLGWPKEAPYNRILVSAAAKKLPRELVNQLLKDGVMVVPVQNSILKVHKTKNGELVVDEHQGYAFVPLL